MPDLTWPQVTFLTACLALIGFVLHLLFQAGHDPMDALNHPFVLTGIGGMFAAAGIGRIRGG